MIDVMRLWLMTLALVLGPALAGTTTSGGDAGSERTRRQAQRVMNAGLPFAERALAEAGEFTPFGAVMLPDGLIQNVAPGSPRPDAPVEVLLEQLSHALRDAVSRDEYLVVAVFSMVEVRDPQDGATRSAVHVAVEHLAGYCVDLFYPILVHEDGPRLGQPSAAPRNGTFFACESPAI